MRIAQVSPLIESVPPRQYGGTERVVSYLTEELVRMGHEVSLFASGDSVTKANLEAVYPFALRLDSSVTDRLIQYLLMFERVCQRAEEFDIIHFHTGFLHFPLCRRLTSPHITTQHGRLDLAEILPLFREFSELPYVSISDSQRRPIPWAAWQGTVYNGIPKQLFSFQPVRGKYLVFLGRISPEKGIEQAITIAQRTGMHIKIAAKVDNFDMDYFKSQIKPLLKDQYVEFLGEIGDKDKNDLLGNAYALVFPIDWPEPFGLVMIEAMACGTPVIAFRCGSVPEVMNTTVTGYIVDNLDEACQAVEWVQQLDRRLCRKEFETRFTDRRMTEAYLEIYGYLSNGILRPRFAAE